MLDAGMKLDASTRLDASMSKQDASMTSDASNSRPDTSVTQDASDVTPDGEAMDAAGATDAGSGSGCTTVTKDYCTKLPALAAPPQLDGVLDCGPGLVDIPTTSWNTSQTLPSDNHARYAAAWRPDGLYLYVEVDDMLRLPALASDVDPWCGDGVELYADSNGTFTSAPDYDYPGAIQLIAAAPARNANTSLAIDARYHTRSQQRVGNWAAARHVMVPRDDGYALEAFIAAADLDLTTWTLAAGSSVGFDIAINVSVASETQNGSCGYNLGQYYLRVSRTPCSTDSCRPHTTASAFCTASLE